MGVTTSSRGARATRAAHRDARARERRRAEMSSEDPATGLMARGASTAYGTESRAREANGVEDERVAEVRRARRIGARTRGSGIAVAVAVALACALAVAAVREGAAVRSRATARLGGTANERGNFFGAPLSAEARMRAPAKADVINRISLRTRVPGLRSPGRGVPGLRTHVRETQRASDDARILILTKPFEWGMTYLQIQSVKRWAPALLPHVTVLTYDTETQRSCEAHRGVDCFYDADFARAYGQDPNDGVARDAMSWRKVHAALELLKARIPVVMLDSDTVFLSDPTEAWTSALEKYDVVVSSDVGNEFEAQGNMNTKLVIFPATTRSVSLCERWLEGESRLVSKVNYGEFPEQSYFNYVLVPTTAGEFHIHAMSTAESGNFITANAGDDGTFPGAHTVTASYCGDARDKEQFLQHVLETKHNAEAALGIGPDATTAIPLRSATDFDHDGVADLARFPHPDLRCDHVKRRLVDQRRYEVTSDRHIVWT